MPAVVGQRYPSPGAGASTGSPTAGPEGSLLASIGGIVQWASIVTDGTDVLVDGNGDVILVIA